MKYVSLLMKDLVLFDSLLLSGLCDDYLFLKSYPFYLLPRMTLGEYLHVSLQLNVNSTKNAPVDTLREVLLTVVPE